MHKKNAYKVYSSDVRPDNTLIFPTNEVKLLDNLAAPQEMNSYQQLLIGTRNDPNVSPELYEQLKRNDKQPVFD